MQFVHPAPRAMVIDITSPENTKASERVWFPKEAHCHHFS
jgi:hypothetical protein